MSKHIDKSTLTLEVDPTVLPNYRREVENHYNTGSTCTGSTLGRTMSMDNPILRRRLHTPSHTGGQPAAHYATSSTPCITIISHHKDDNDDDTRVSACAAWRCFHDSTRIYEMDFDALV